jgi:hypothetical protein
MVAECLGSNRVSVTGTQSIAEDWKQGVKKNLQLITGFDHKSSFNIDTVKIDIELRFNLGYLLENFDDEAEKFFYPTMNDIYGQMMVSYPLGWTMNPFMSVSSQTQPVESFRKMNDKLIRTAKFWDPVTIRESMGFCYSYVKNQNNIRSNIGLSLQQVRADKHYMLTDDWKTKDIIERYKTDSGISIKNEMRLKLNDNINYRNSLDLFTSFDDLNIWTLRLENQLDIKIWKFLGIVVDFNIYYDDNQMKNIQYIQNTQLGIVSTF